MQWIAEFTQGMVLVGLGPKVIVFYVLKFIGYSYRAALDPENAFVLSLLGFTLGVGFCEELTKVLPVWWRARGSDRLDPRGIVALGFASGVGFGVSEGVTYSQDMYNGIEPVLIYVVRFVSCVGLHAVWAATAGLTLYRRVDVVAAEGGFVGKVVTLMGVLAVPMLLHGLYDTALKRDLNLLALATAVVSFGWFFWQLVQVEEQGPRRGVVQHGT